MPYMDQRLGLSTLICVSNSRTNEQQHSSIYTDVYEPDLNNEHNPYIFINVIKEQ